MTLLLKQEFDERGNHRLVNVEDGRHTDWAGYTGWTYLDGMVGVTDYYTGTGEKILTPEELAAHGVRQSEPRAEPYPAHNRWG